MEAENFNQSLEQLNSLFDHDRKEVSKILALVEQDLKNLFVAFERKNTEEIKSKIHQLKSALAMCSFNILSAKAGEIEKLAKENSAFEKEKDEFNNIALPLLAEIKTYLCSP